MKYKRYSDEELLEFYRKNSDSKVIGELYIRYGHLVLGSCLNYLKNKEDADDVTMNIFESLGNKIQRYQITYFKSWLFVLTRNECLMLLRKKKTPNLQIDEQLIEAETDDIETKEILEIKLKELEAAIEQLNPPQDEVIKLFYMRSMTYQAISDKLGLTLKKVKSALQNGKRNLKIKLKENDLFKSA